MKTADLQRSKRLKELGVKQESYLHWCFQIWGGTEAGWVIVQNPTKRKKNNRGDLIGYADDEIISAFTVAELIEIIFTVSRSIKLEKGKETEANTLAKMLIHLIERGLLKP